jgi:hypothetical protein
MHSSILRRIWFNSRHIIGVFPALLQFSQFLFFGFPNFSAKWASGASELVSYKFYNHIFVFFTRMNAQSAEEVRYIMDDPTYQDIMRREFSPACYQLPRCDPTQKYRSACGACNNLRVPLYGKAFTPFRRIVESAYEDGT